MLSSKVFVAINYKKTRRQEERKSILCREYAKGQWGAKNKEGCYSIYLIRLLNDAIDTI